MKFWLRRVLGVSLCLAAFHFSTLRGQDNDAPAAPAPVDTGNGAPAPAPSGPTADTPTGSVSDASATFQTFYDGLAGEGTWIQTQQYGYVWQPQVTDPNWAPYTDGYWAYTDQGWTWVSNEAWGWATYHYGRWANLENVGWVWVPGYVWAPAWVSWRTGDGNVGWAPLPPDSMAGPDYSATDTTNVAADTSGDVNADVDYHIGDDSDYYYGIGPAWYIFIPIGFFCHHDYHGHYCNRNDNYWLINHTKNVTNINVNHNGGAGRFHHVTTGGPSVAEINAGSDTPVQKVSLAAADKPGGGTLNGDTLSIFAPHIHTSSGAAPKQVGMSYGDVRLNHGLDVTRPLAVNNSISPTAATLEQIQKARDAQINAPSNSKVLTDPGMIKPIVQRPVVTMKPIAAPIMPVTHGSPTFSTGGTPQVPGELYAPQQRTFPQTSSQGATTIHGGPNQVYPSNPTVQHVIPGSSNPYAPRTAVPGTTTQNSSGSVPGESSRVYEHSAPSSTTTTTTSSSSPYWQQNGSQGTTTTTTPGGGAPAAPSSGPTHH